MVNPASVYATAVATKAALYAATDHYALASKRTELEYTVPEKMKQDKVSQLIIQLPIIFRENGFKNSAVFMEAWQFGLGVNSEADKRYLLFKHSSFATSRSVMGALAEARASATFQIAESASDGYKESRWNVLRSYIQDISTRNAKSGKNEWDVTLTPNNRSIHSPQWAFDHEKIGHTRYLNNFELRTDAYGSLARFNVNAYIRRARVVKKGGKIFITPTKIGIRIEDSYDFNDGSIVDAIIGQLAASKPSQFLGAFKPSPDAEAVALTNNDFQNFRNKYQGLKVTSLKGADRKLFCNDFKLYSEIEESALSIPEMEMGGVS